MVRRWVEWERGVQASMPCTVMNMPTLPTTSGNQRPTAASPLGGCVRHSVRKMGRVQNPGHGRGGGQLLGAGDGGTWAKKGTNRQQKPRFKKRR